MSSLILFNLYHIPVPTTSEKKRELCNTDFQLTTLDTLYKLKKFQSSIGRFG